MKPVHPRKRKNHSQAESRKQLCEEMMLGLFVFLVRISVKKKLKILGVFYLWRKGAFWPSESVVLHGASFCYSQFLKCCARKAHT